MYLRYKGHLPSRFNMIHNFYLGAVSAIFLLNAVQWSFSRDWVHGLFTFHPFVWLVLAVVQSLPFTEPIFLAVHTGGDGLILISYVEMVHRLFGHQDTQLQFRRWIRPVQLSILAYVLVEICLLLTVADRWLHASFYPYASLVYWSTLTTCCAMGMGIAVRRGNAVGWFFFIGSFLLMLNEAQSVYYFFTRLFMNGPAVPSPAIMQVIQQIIIGGFIIKLLCFSLCLVFWQRKAAVARAVVLARTEEQLVQERLEAELIQQRLEQEKTQVQLQALQAQVNPHFLFNSLNSLSALIDDDPERAGQFVDQLSVVYRYLLRATHTSNEPKQDRQHSLTTLANELAFMESYYHLLRTRYGGGLNMHVSIRTQYQALLLPPLTLQLLVENAVKHNVTSSKRPLTVEIFVDPEGYLTVRNNLQRKRSRVLSNGVGLSTIAAQYVNLQQSAPEVSAENDQFTVRLPLIVPSPNIVDSVGPNE